MVNPLDTQWFKDARYGLFVHWGPYAALGRGEQVLFREYLDPLVYERNACRWDPQHFDAPAWAEAAVAGGFRYSVLTARHHDGYCLWDSQQTDYTSVRQAPGRDFVAHWVEAQRRAGLRVGLYYSLADWRVPAYWRPADANPEAWGAYRGYVHAQVEELLTRYGRIDLLWFDGAWPHPATDWDSEGLLRLARRLQPGILVNNRLDAQSPFGASSGAVEAAGESRVLGDFGTPEHHITAEPDRPWESCQTSVSRLWGFAAGEHWRPTWQVMDMIGQCASQGGNLLLNVGPDGEGRMPQPFLERSGDIGLWLTRNGEAVFGTSAAADLFDTTTLGYLTRRGNTLYLILRFWHEGLSDVRLPHLASRVLEATWLDTGQPLRTRRLAQGWVIDLTPRETSPPGYPVVKIDCESPLQIAPAGRNPLWQGDPGVHLSWVRRNVDPPWNAQGTLA